MTLPGLVEALESLASRAEVVSYGALARRLALPSPGSIARLTQALEALMVEDATTGRPFRAALCHARLAGELPAHGYFDKAQALGRFDGGDRLAHVQAERAQLYAARS
ncbi:hypothetical protein [Pseudorhodobacter ferrugineus]|uniref:hypothetical protein n=1 Tax=Pseudorhodobacter ferrugineus TaxID=77008 RepID=UPI0003B3686C|nr:hypothetical protein [Pseudorhodobacter ferrugineus]